MTRKRIGKETAVCLEGVLVPAKKVKREIRRHRQDGDDIHGQSYDHSKYSFWDFKPAACLTFAEANNPPTPDGITISTPIPIEDSLGFFDNIPIAQYVMGLFTRGTSTLQSCQIHIRKFRSRH